MKSNLVIIDADSIVYLVASQYKDAKIRSSALNTLDDFIMSILKVTYSKHYYGFFGKINGVKNFRYNLAKTKPYKGNRPDKEDWFLYWEKVLKTHMKNVWGFIPVEYVEADDMCTITATLHENDPKFGKIWISSPDKDLMQKGNSWNYNYKTHKAKFISKRAGDVALYKQMIEGDSADNIPGIPGAGEKIVNTVFGEIDDNTNLNKFIRDLYKTYLHDKIPAAKVKREQKEYLIKYKKENNISRLTKKLKENALKSFTPSDSFTPEEGYSDIIFDEMYSLLYMLRTKDELNKYWVDYVFTSPVKDKYINWQDVDKNKELIEEEIVEEDFEEDLDFLLDDTIDDL